MHSFRQIFHHPAGRVGLAVGFLLGVLAVLMSEANRALFVLDGHKPAHNPGSIKPEQRDEGSEGALNQQAAFYHA